MSAPTRPHRAPVLGFPDMGPFWTLANGLSLSHVLLLGPIAWLVYRGGPMGWMFGLIGVAIATDFFDGRLARWRGAVSEWGKVLDATADKLAAAAVTLALLTRPESAGPSLPLWFVLLAITRDAILAVGGLIQTRRLGRFTSSLWSGKVAVTLLALVVVAALAKAPPGLLTPLVWGTALVMGISLAEYFVRFRAILRLGPAALEADGNALRRGQ